MQTQSPKHKRFMKENSKKTKSQTKGQYAATYNQNGKFRACLLSEVLFENIRIVSERSGSGFVIFGIYDTVIDAGEACKKMGVFQNIREIEGPYENN